MGGVFEKYGIRKALSVRSGMEEENRLVTFWGVIFCLRSVKF